MWRVALIIASACSDVVPDAPDAGSGGDPVDGTPDAGPIGTPSIEGTPVSSFESSSCSTSVLKPLSVQIAQEVDCLMPGQLVEFDAGPVIEITGSSVLPFLSESARTALYAAAEQANGTKLRVNSALRTVDTQYLLRRWFELGRCGITAAAQPGSSNHESGRALDIQNYDAWIGKLGAQGWAHDIPGDPVHFEHRASPDLRGVDVLAFQRLWNRNAPDDQIAEDGAYGPMTAARLRRAPAEGFGIGAFCASARIAEGVARIEHATAPDAVECAH